METKKGSLFLFPFFVSKASLFLSNILKQKPDKKSKPFFVSNNIFVFVRSGQTFFVRSSNHKKQRKGYVKKINKKYKIVLLQKVKKKL